MDLIYKTYLVFGGQSHYAVGGFNDLVSTCPTLADANTVISALEDYWRGTCDEFSMWWHIVELTMCPTGVTHNIIAQSETLPFGHPDKPQ